MASIKRQWVRIVKDEPKGEPWRDTIVYFVQCQTTKMVKIGFASDPSSRLSNLQTGSPTRLRYVFYSRRPRTQERELHEMFKEDRSHGEWFFPSERLLAFIEGLIAEETAREDRLRAEHYAKIEGHPLADAAKVLEFKMPSRFAPLLRPAPTREGRDE